MRSKRWAKALISKLTGNKLDIRAERVKALMKKLDAAAKSNYGRLAKTANVTENAQKSTESDEKSEGEQTGTEEEKGAETAENDVKMSVVEEYDSSLDDVIDLSLDTELASIVDGVYGSQKYKKIAQYILEVLGDEEIILSDGRKAVVDKSDAMHIANKAAPKKTAKIAKIKEIIQKARIYAQDTNAEHNKFNQFFYYVANVRIGVETFPVYLNVGKAKNDGTYHIYDITNKIKDTADRINGLERPKPNEGYALKNGISNNSISQISQNVNDKFSLSPEANIKMSVVGESSKTADIDALHIAMKMLAKDSNANTVAETGWWQGKDGKWRYEIADNEMRFERDGLYRNPQTLEDYIEHDKLFEAYPWLRNVRVEVVDLIGNNPQIMATYNEATDTISIRKSAKDSDATKRDLIHEIQHAVQKFEGFKGGSNTNNAAFYLLEMYYNRVKDLPKFKQIKTPEGKKHFIIRHAEKDMGKSFSEVAFDAYSYDYGEVEARESASRMELTPEQRKGKLISYDGIVFDEARFEERMIDILQDLGYTKNQIYDFYKNGDFFNDELANVSQSARASESRAERSDTERSGRSQEAIRQNSEHARRVHGTFEGGSNDAANSQASVRGLRGYNNVKFSLSEADADYLSSVENGDMEAVQRMVDESKEDIRWSVSPSLDSDIDSVLNGTFDASRNEVYLGETSQFMTDVIGARSLALYMPAAKVYSSILTRDEYNKKPYYTEQGNYHGIGKDDFIDILERSENPIAAFADTPDINGNKRHNRIVLVTDKIIKDAETGEEGYAVVVEEVDTTARNSGMQVKANKAITVYPRTKLYSDISNAMSDGRLLDITKKGEQLFAGRRGANSQATIQKAVLKKNIANFWTNVKWANEKNKIYSSAVTPTTTAMEDAIKNSSYYKSMQNSENDTDRRSSLSEDVDTDNELSYEQLKRQLEKQKQKNKELAGELIRTHGKKPDPKSEKANLKDIIQKYQGTIKPADVERKFQRAFEYVFNKKLVTYNEDGSLVPLFIDTK